MRRRRQPTAASMIQIGLAGILIILLVLLVVWWGDGLNSYDPEEGTYQYVAGVKVDFSEKATYRNNKGSVSVWDDGEEHTLDSIPILYENERKMTLPVNMMIMMPSQSATVRRVNYFTTIKEKNGIVTLEKDKKTADVFGGFLYDGEDTYVFLEKMTFYIGSRKIVMEPLSYANVAYKQYVEYYNSADNSHEWVSIDDIEIRAESDSGYTIDLGKDVIDMGSGEMLIYSAVDSLKVITMR